MLRTVRRPLACNHNLHLHRHIAVNIGTACTDEQFLPVETMADASACRTLFVSRECQRITYVRQQHLHPAVTAFYEHHSALIANQVLGTAKT